MKFALIPALLAMLALGGCAEMSYPEQRVLSGGTVTVSNGPLTGWAGGCPACGANMGGGQGADYFFDSTQKFLGAPY